MMIQVTAYYNGKAYQLSLSQAQARKYDNGALISCGLRAPDDISESAMRWLISHGRAVEIPMEQARHSACQSYCVLRGDDKCQW
jgi:hypothetical protein